MAPLSSSAQSFLSYFDTNKDRLLEDLFKFLRFQSISTNPAHASEVRECASWLADYVRKIGFDAEIWETNSHPVLYASWLKAGPDKPTLLIYNHYDVQPIDPLELWDTPPFEPSIREGEIYARGANDDKGQCFYVLSALHALFERDGALPINVKLCIEGEEECGSSGLSEILSEKAEALKADHLLIVDLGFISANRPSVTLGCRGIAALTVEASGANSDLHSGSHGGIVYNTNHALIELLAKLRDPSGKIAVPGFYDQVSKPTKEELSQICFDFDPESYEKTFGAKADGGEKEFSPFESAWVRPTLEINGISGGYAGEGFKTVIPQKATAKISCRLVPQQDPKRIFDLVSKFLIEHAPEGIELEIHSHVGGHAVRSSVSSKAVQAAAASYSEVYEKSCAFILEGGSIPITAELAEAAQAQIVLIGNSLPDDNAHAPNEHFGIDRIKQGLAVIGRILEQLGE